ncbi:unnamed protein product [Urochloa humidicola]
MAAGTQAAPAPSKMEPAYVLAPLGVLFLCCQLMLCRARFCCWSNHWLVPHLAEAGDFLPNMLGSIAMASIPEEPSAVVLMLCLILLNNSMAAYDREKINLRYLWTAVNIIYFAYRALNTVSHADLGSKGRYVGAYAIVITMVFAYAYCIIFVAVVKASKHYPEAIAEHMSTTENVLQTEDQYNASTLNGYRYVVLLEPNIRTVDEIFSGGEDERHKYLCLSFSLFQLLFCLYNEVPWYHEASGRKSWKLVVEGLLGRPPQQQPQPLPLLPPQQQPPPQHQAAATAAATAAAQKGFGVVEVELAFLHDHVHGGYILCPPGSGSFRALYCVLKTVMAAIMYIGGLVLYFRSDRPRVSVIISPLLLYLLFDLLQVVFYCRSDRWMVSYMCHPDTWQQRYFGWFIRLIRRPELNNCSNFYWLDSVRQYSLLEETRTHRGNNGGPTTPFGQTSLYSHSAEPSGPVALPTSLKLRIAEVLGGTNCLVPVPFRVQSAQRFPGGTPKEKIGVILKWHIATSYCEMMIQEDINVSPNREVAAVLSKYCAYLVAFRPELLPCPDVVTKHTFCNVLKEVTRVVGGLKHPQNRLAMLHVRRVAGNSFGGLADEDILTQGLRLGYLLVTQIQNQQNLWMILESIWVKMILSVAPQESSHDATYAKSHAKYLAQGGEFLTYLWAMLSHAGIQKHIPWPPCIRMLTVPPWHYYT